MGAVPWFRYWTGMSSKNSIKIKNLITIATITQAAAVTIVLLLMAMVLRRMLTTVII
jgi:hypothetical protein